MAPTYHDGDLAYIDRSIESEPGDHVVAILENGDCVFRVYRPTADGKINLDAINKDCRR